MYVQVHAVLKDVAPVFPLVDTLLVGLGKGRVVVELESKNVILRDVDRI